MSAAGHPKRGMPLVIAPRGPKVDGLAAAPAAHSGWHNSSSGGGVRLAAEPPAHLHVQRLGRASLVLEIKRLVPLACAGAGLCEGEETKDLVKKDSVRAGLLVGRDAANAPLTFALPLPSQNRSASCCRAPPRCSSRAPRGAGRGPAGTRAQVAESGAAAEKRGLCRPAWAWPGQSLDACGQPAGIHLCPAGAADTLCGFPRAHPVPGSGGHGDG